MRKIILIWSYWLIFCLAGLVLIWIVEHSDLFPGVAVTEVEQQPSTTVSVSEPKAESMPTTPFSETEQAPPLAEEMEYVPLKADSALARETESQEPPKTPLLEQVKKVNQRQKEKEE